MSSDDAGYFYVLHQAELDLELDHDDLIQLDREGIGKVLDLWFAMRSVITQRIIEPTESLKDGVYNVKEQERESEEGI